MPISQLLSWGYINIHEKTVVLTKLIDYKYYIIFSITSINEAKKSKW